MNEFELLEQAANDLVKRIKELRTKQTEKQEKSVTRWRGNEGDRYWYVDDTDEVTYSYEENLGTDDFRYCTGNYFETEHECEQYFKNLKTKQELKDLALKLNNGKEIDWSDTEQTKFFIVLNCTKDYLEQNHTYIICDVGQVHCLDRGFLTEAIMEIGKDNLINVIKSGV